MRVACVCNMNNNFFSLVRYLRDRGIPADLLLLESEADHFLPSADTFDSDYKDFTTTLTWGKIRRFLHFNKRLSQKVASDLEKYDFLIGCGPVPAYLEKIGRKLDIFVPYGGDLFLYPFFRPLEKQSLKFKAVSYRLHKHQRAGIRNTKYIVTDDVGKDAEAAFAEIGLNGQRLNCGTPMVYVPLYNPQTIQKYYPQSQWYRSFKEIRDKHDLVIFHHARHIWKGTPSVASKGNDKLFRGFAKFVEQNKSSNPCIITCEYGSDIQDSKALIQSLGIQDRVYWFPLLPRKEIMIGLSLCDIGCGEFQVSWLSGGTIDEVLSMGKPLMHYREDSLYTSVHPELYPMINVHSSEEVTHALHDYVSRPDYYRHMGEQGRKWFEQYAIDVPLKLFTKIIQESCRSTIPHP